MKQVVTYEGDMNGGVAFVCHPAEERFEYIKDITPADLSKRISSDALVLLAPVVASNQVIDSGVAEQAIPAVVTSHGMELRSSDKYRIAARVQRGLPEAMSRPYMLVSVSEELAAQFGKRQVMPTPLAYSQDGTYLAVRFDGVELTQIHKGALAGFGRANVAGVASLNGQDAVPAYAEQVAIAVSEVMRDQIMSKSLEVERITIHGVGAALPEIGQAVQERLAVTVNRPEGPTPAGDNSVAYGGWQGCQLTDAMFDPQQEAFAANPQTAADSALGKAKRQRLGMRAAMAVAAVLLLAVAVLPYLSARSSLSAAKQDYGDRVTNFATVANTDELLHLRDEGNILASGLVPNEVDWSSAIGWLVMDTPPSGTQWSVVQLVRSDLDPGGVSEGPVSVRLTGEASVGGLSFDELSLWLDQLELSGLRSAWIDSFSRVEGTQETQPDGTVVQGRQAGSVADIRIETGYLPPIFPAAEPIEDITPPDVNDPAPTGSDAPLVDTEAVPEGDPGGAAEGEQETPDTDTETQDAAPQEPTP